MNEYGYAPRPDEIATTIRQENGVVYRSTETVSTITGNPEGLSVTPPIDNGWTMEIERLKAEVERLQAEAAGMRLALEECLAIIVKLRDYNPKSHEIKVMLAETYIKPNWGIIEGAEAALSTTAGASLLDRLKKAEAGIKRLAAFDATFLAAWFASQADDGDTDYLYDTIMDFHAAVSILEASMRIPLYPGYRKKIAEALGLSEEILFDSGNTTV
jgi:hypothetical protein